MNSLTIIKHNENKLLTISSREVAKMIGKEHPHLLRDIRGYIEAITKSQNPNLDSQNFFIESTYQGERREEKCFLLTKKGCDMVANKMTGEKGIIFTATYVSKFEDMEQALKGNLYLNHSDISSFIENKVDNEIEKLSINYADYIRPLAKDKARLSKYIKDRLGITKADKDFYLVKERTLILLDADKWEDVPIIKLKEAFKLIDESIEVIMRGRAIQQRSWI